MCGCVMKINLWSHISHSEDTNFCSAHISYYNYTRCAGVGKMCYENATCIRRSPFLDIYIICFIPNAFVSQPLASIEYGKEKTIEKTPQIVMMFM